ncbi:HDOD domain-containing protein [Ectothiorhodospira lacustris]|uniref:HDOD domain-containing protein n=1 Tax=Ectothiorhodospira lacustris TaxID=2899127 RepID=UPI001EE8DCB8|nr:HDOD domain-containing protein [Ectothiorhodospira lacustris]MCG5499959.1 HDOD domain-containing protein [Ectothiorhodospira lacustris]MCG5510931.1 HDOD domain-containing protein [Ectothiorhodospira lacustris]MCG5522663.1 HDOD domain-containing protein [Ectothiorhodospira lacustris]
MNNNLAVPPAADPTTLEDWTHMLREQEMPIFSSTVQTIHDIIGDERKGAMDLATAILQDPNLTAKLLKLSNSLYYNPYRKKIVTVSRAIVILGIDVIRELVLACSFFEAILSPRNKRRAHEEIAQAIHAAVHAKAIAIAAGDAHPEEVFIAALLQNIGRIAFWCFCRDQGERLEGLLQEGHIPQDAAERQVLGFRLAELDVSLCKSWNLKGLIEEAIRKSPKVFDPRMRIVNLGCEVVVILKETTGSQPYNACLDRIGEITGQTRDEVKQGLRANTDAAARIARQFGAVEAAELIQHKARQLDAEEESAAIAVPDRKELQFQILQEISGMLSGGKLDISCLLEMILEGIQRGIGMDRTIFTMLSTDRGLLREKVALGWRRNDPSRAISFPLSQSPPNLFHQALYSREGYWITGHDSRLHTAHDVAVVGRHPCFLMSIYSEGKPIGLIYCDRAYTGMPLTEEDFRAFRHFVQQANIGLSLYRLQER